MRLRNINQLRILKTKLEKEERNQNSEKVYSTLDYPIEVASIKGYLPPYYLLKKNKIERIKATKMSHKVINTLYNLDLSGVKVISINDHKLNIKK